MRRRHAFPTERVSKRSIRLLFLLVAMPFFLLVAFCGFHGGTTALAYDGGKALILVDEQHTPGIYPSTEATLADLLGHFDIAADIKPVDSYTAGEIEGYRITFYLGNSWDHALPSGFLDDVLATDHQVVWIGFNLWKLGWGEYQAAFEARYGISYVTTLPTGAFTRVTYAGRNFTRSQESFARVRVLDPGKTAATAYITDGSRRYPYIIKSGNFFFVSDDPLVQTAEESPFLVLADQLHDMVLIDHPVRHQALVRIEDVGPADDPAHIRAIADYLHGENVPFTLAVTPVFSDPLGATGPPANVTLADRPELVEALKYAEARGGTIIMHGKTHQYDSLPNPYNGVSGMDSEFALQRLDAYGNMSVSPLPEDSESWVRERVASGRALFTAAGLAQPDIWETPHYLASDLDRRVLASQFGASYERFADTYFPYVINRSVYGSRLIPENLGYISPGTVTSQMIVSRAGRNLAVRDGFASFFFHPEVDISHLKSAVSGIKAKGYTFVDVRSLTGQDPGCSGEAPDIRLGEAAAYWASFSDYRARVLTVRMTLTNHSEAAALAVTIISADATEGASLAGTLPLPVDIAAGESAVISIEYKVPSGVSRFHILVRATAEDACGNIFSYPPAA